MSLTIPYTYLIGWSKQNKFYYGRRTSKGCNPSEFWITYKSSSKEVKKFVDINGNPDIIQIRKTFKSVKECCNWEYRVLSRLKVRVNEKYLNKIAGVEDFYYGITGPKSATHKENIKKAIQKRLSDPNYVHPCKGRKGSTKPPRTKEHREKLSKGSLGNKNASCPRSEETKNKLRKPKPKNVCRIHDKKEMNISHFIQWNNRQKLILADSPVAL